VARVVGVHGAFHELWGPHQIAGRWIPALRDGLALGRYVDDDAMRDAVRDRVASAIGSDTVVADGRPLAAVFPGVVEERVDNGQRAHDPEPYLCARVTGAAIAAAMG
jgi:hypothetical protein